VTDKFIYKICTIAEWSNALSKNVFEGSPVDEADGYIHFSIASQVRKTTAKYFSDVSDLYLLEVDITLLTEPLLWEESRGGDLFPHLYGSLPTTAVTAVHPLPLGQDGLHQFPNHIGEAP
jgi:uncharacterized protein (DUF952 family)